MTVKQIAIETAELLQADDIAELLSATAGADAADDADVKTLVRCVCLAAAELNADFPVISTITATAEGGFIPLSAFGGTVSAVIKAERNGRPVRFTLDTRGVGVPADGEYTLTFTLAPSASGLDDELSVGAGVDAHTAVYLAARNYCLVTGRADDAAVWDQLYNADAATRRLRRRAVLPKRTFL